MDYSIMQEIFQKIREQQDDEYWLDILHSGDYEKDFPEEDWEVQEINLVSTEVNDDDLAF